MTPLKAHQVLSPEEIREFTRPSTLRGLWALAVDWGVIAASMYLCALWPNALSCAVAVILIGGRQLGLAVLSHEASHRSLFAARALNDVLGRWLCAAPVWVDLVRYRVHHMAHHTKTGTDEDPDICLVEPFPAPPRALLRKFARDVLGLTGLKRALATLAMDLEFISYTASGNARRLHAALPGRARRAASRLLPVLVTNGLLLGVLSALGEAWLYLLWLGAWMTSYSLFLRIRAIAEHACTRRDPDILLNTRSTRAGWLARLTVSPHAVNYHLEHHLLMTVPFFALPKLHRRLVERGVQMQLAPSYFAVLRLASTFD